MAKYERAEKLQDHTPEALDLWSKSQKDRAWEAQYAYLFTCYTHYTLNDSQQHALIRRDTAVI